jgi:hypothetical protein
MEGISESELCIKDPGREMVWSIWDMGNVNGSTGRVSLGTDGDEDDGGISGTIKLGTRSKPGSALYCGATVLLDGRVGDNGESVVEAAVTVAGRGSDSELATGEIIGVSAWVSAVARSGVEIASS